MGAINIATYLVLMGAALLIASLFYTRKVVNELPPSDTRWRFLYLVILFITVGYMVFVIAIFGEPQSFAVRSLALIFFGGGCLVVTLTYMTARTIRDVRNLANLAAEKTQISDMRNRLETILDNIAEGVITFDRTGTIDNMNWAAEKLFGYDTSEIAGKNITLLIPPSDPRNKREGYLEHFMRHEIQRLMMHPGEVIGRHKDGVRFPMLLKLSKISLNGQELYTALATDISERKAMQDHLKVMTEQDGLTGLFNRSYFLGELEHFVERAKRTLQSCALLYIDIDNFTYINDTLGHAAGDHLIIEVGNILQRRARKADVIARMGGDEFTVLLYNTNTEQAQHAAEYFRQKLASHHFVQNGESAQLGCSIGIAIISIDTRDASEAMSQADLACHLAKRQGRNRVHMYTTADTQSSAVMTLDMGWSQRIKEAIKKNRFALACQPIVHTLTREIESYEVLIRMLDRDGELIMPNSFLPTAERFGLSADIDKWVIINAIQALNEQRRHKPNLRYSLNLSGQTLTDPSICDLVLSRLQATGLDPAALTFEVTETVAIADMAVAAAFLSRLQAIGCKTALDDFGSGMASFAYLKDLPVDFVKIDGRFVKNLDTSSIDQAMVKAMNDIAQALGKKTIAEFVENEASFELLQEYGVNYGQGYHLGRPDVTPPCLVTARETGKGNQCGP